MPTDKKFTGQRLDDTGLYYYGARYYDPAIGRFISPDTIIPNPANPQSFNRYTYCLNNPLKYTDPSGNQEIEETVFGLQSMGLTPVVFTDPDSGQVVVIGITGQPSLEVSVISVPGMIPNAPAPDAYVIKRTEYFNIKNFTYLGTSKQIYSSDRHGVLTEYMTVWQTKHGDIWVSVLGSSNIWVAVDIWSSMQARGWTYSDLAEIAAHNLPPSGMAPNWMEIVSFNEIQVSYTPGNASLFPEGQITTSSGFNCNIYRDYASERTRQMVNDMIF